jgi:hypothetical protein
MVLGSAPVSTGITVVQLCTDGESMSERSLIVELLETVGIMAALVAIAAVGVFARG